MKISSFLIPILSLSITAIFTGCATSGYSKFYQENQSVSSLLISDKNKYAFLSDSEEPKIMATDNIPKDLKIMISKRFVPIGRSSFNGEVEGLDAVKEQARRVKAVAVIYTSKYTNTQTNSGTLLIPQTNYYSGTVNVSNGYNTGYAAYNGTSTTTMAMPYSNTQRRFDQEAIFFIKDIHPMKFGIQTIDISREKRIEIGRNGVLVETIFEDAPVYKSNLMLGDIIVELDNKQVESTKEFYKSLVEFDTSKGFCDFKILRDGIEQIIRIKFS